jgi:hypothetical protein
MVMLDSLGFATGAHRLGINAHRPHTDEAVAVGREVQEPTVGGETWFVVVVRSIGQLDPLVFNRLAAEGSRNQFDRFRRQPVAECNPFAIGGKETQKDFSLSRPDYVLEVCPVAMFTR